MRPHRLQRVAGRGVQVAVVDDQRSAGGGRQPLANRAGNGIAFRRKLDDVAVPALAANVRVDQPEHQPVIPKADHPLVPAPVALLELADGNCIEEFVGDQDHGSMGHGRQCIVPADTGADGLGLARPAAAGLVSTRCTCAARMKSGAAFPTVRRMSVISVPRPGPSSTRLKLSGAPIACHAATHQMPISSPKTWLTSGAVMKSPSAPKGSRLHVVAVLRMTETESHVAVQPHRAFGCDHLPEETLKRQHDVI